MEWIEKLLYDPNSIAHTVMLYAFVIAVGVMLGKIKIGKISLGVTYVLFVGICMGHFGFTANHGVTHFIKEFGLILFVFSIGLQVGPGFFSSFKEGGMKLNLLAVGIIFLNVIVALFIYYSFGGRIDLPMVVGILSGAVTNTPGLGAAQEALKSISYSGPSIALGYAVAYPLGVVGIIVTMILIRYIFRVNLQKETKQLDDLNDAVQTKPHRMHLLVTNQALNGKTIDELTELVNRSLVISRIMKENRVSIPNTQTIINTGDKIYISCAECDSEAIIAMVGEIINVDWDNTNCPMVSRRILVTQSSINGKMLGELKLRNVYSVNITRINRSGMDLLATPNLVLHIGDNVMVVGEEDAVDRVSKYLGNSMKRLNEPNLITIFVGIFIGILFGSIPVAIPGIPTPIKLGLAGGPLIIAILLGRFGYKFNLVTYLRQSANLMLREVGIVLFLASVGIEAGSKFVETVVQGDGLLWIGCGFIITFIPLLIIGIIARGYFKINYYTITGMMAGATTDPPALAYANMIADNDTPAVAYSTVYPLTMFLRVLLAQLLILIFA